MIVSMTFNDGKHIAEFELSKNYRQLIHRFLLNLFESKDDKFVVTLNGLSWEFDKVMFDIVYRSIYEAYQIQYELNEKKILSKLLVNTPKKTKEANSQ